MGILRRLRAPSLRDFCIEEYGDDFADIYDKFLSGEPVGNWEKTVAILNMVDYARTKREIVMAARNGYLWCCLAFAVGFVGMIAICLAEQIEPYTTFCLCMIVLACTVGGIGIGYFGEELNRRGKRTERVRYRQKRVRDSGEGRP